MITHDNVVRFFKESLTKYFRGPVDPNTGEYTGQYQDFADELDVFEESSYNSKKDIVVTLQFLKGTTQLGFTDLPINVIFEVIEGKATNNKTMAIQVMDLINSFIEDYNDKTTESAITDDNNVSYVVTQYYSSTFTIGNGQQRGINKYKAFTMDMRLIIYENGYYQTLQGQKIEFNLAVNNTPKLINVLEIITHISHSQTGYTAGASPNQKLKITSIQYTLQVTYIATKTNTLHVKIADEALSDVTYSVSHTGLTTSPRTANVKLIDYTEGTPYADVTKVTLTLAREG